MTTLAWPSFVWPTRPGQFVLRLITVAQNPILWYPTFWLITILHLAWGAALLSSSAPLGITGLLVCSSTGLPHAIVGFVYLLATACAIFRLIRGLDGFGGFLLLAPQMFLLTMSGAGAGYRAWIQAYADGVIRPFLFIGPDQLALILLALFHGLGMLFAHAKVGPA